MRTCLISLMALMMVGFIVGCGGGADEEKPITDVKAEAEKMDTDQLQAKVDEYKKAIEAKKPEIEKLQKELGSGLTGAITGDKPENADELQKELDGLQTSVKALQERCEIYAAELEKKQGS